MQPNKRRESIQVMVGNVPVGGGAPIVVQSMTNTDTADIEATIEQVDQLHLAGSELVRLTVNNDAAAKAVPYIKEGLINRGVMVPLIGDFHYNGHVLLSKYPDMAQALSKYRINPGNTGTKTRDKNFATIVEQAIKHDKPVRIGVNWGHLINSCWPKKWIIIINCLFQSRQKKLCFRLWWKAQFDHLNSQKM